MSPGGADLGSHVGCQGSHFIFLCLSFPFCKSEIAHSASEVVVDIKEINTQKSTNKSPISTALPVLSTYCSLFFGQKNNWQVTLRLGMTRPRAQGSNLLGSFSFPELFRAPPPQGKKDQSLSLVFDS